MTAANIEAVRAAVRAYSTRDVESLIAHLDPDVEWEPAGPAAVEQALYRGRDEFIAANTALWQVWDALRFEETELRDLGDGTILWLGRAHLRGSASELELDQEFATVFVLQGGLLRRVRAFTSWSEARRSVGLDD
jgi:ketosteroid isomerase-like protein